MLQVKWIGNANEKEEKRIKVKFLSPKSLFM